MIRDVRRRAGVSGRELSQRLGLSHSVVSHWERGRAVPTTEDVASLLTALGISGDEKKRLVALARGANEANWLTAGMPGIPQQLAGVVECERAAVKITEWAPTVVPGLLQTTDYSRALIRATGESPEQTERLLMVRVSRREVVTKRDPVTLVALIGEEVLRDGICEPLIMADQLQHLAQMAGRPNVTIRVMPPRMGWHPGYAGPFNVYEFPDAPPVVYFEHYRSGAFIPDEDDVAAYQTALDRMLGLARTADDSKKLINQIAKERAV